MPAKLINRSLKSVKKMVSIILFAGALLIIALAFTALNSNKSSGQRAKDVVFQPVPTVIHIDSRRLDTMQMQTAKDSLKSVKAWSNAIANANNAANELAAVKAENDSLFVEVANNGAGQ